jgi:hypothetical protein
MILVINIFENQIYIYSYTELLTNYTVKMISDSEEKNIRQPAVAGRFYSDAGDLLLDEVRNFFGRSKPPVRPGDLPRAIIVPHAGYVFSGSVAASGFSQIPGNAVYERVFVLASSHQMHFPGASVYCSGDYLTPLGVVEVDKETGRELTERNSLFNCREEPHRNEHSLEVELPFLQERLKEGFKLVPIILGTRKPEECSSLAKTLSQYFVPGNLFVVSSDFSHYPEYHDAVVTDRITSDAIMTGSPGQLLKVLEEHKGRSIPGLVTPLCGWTSVLTLLYVLEKENVQYEWVDYRNSGDQPQYGEHSRVVGYSAIVVFDTPEPGYSLTLGEKDILLKIAEESIKDAVIPRKAGPLETVSQSGVLDKPAGAFVSIYIKGSLRGCIGSFQSESPLREVVRRAAASAAGDRRFKPPGQEELDDLTIEISVLTPLRRISSKDEIQVGKHGILIRKGMHSGTFLPQVSSKYGWSVDEFLGRCSRDKAGLGWDGWKNAELYTFEAIVFSSFPRNGAENKQDRCSG